MSTKKSIIAFLFAISTFTLVNAQTTFEFPENLELNNAEDYAKYENDIVNTAKWLEETDLDQETDKRDLANAFVLIWLTGSPDVTVLITAKLGDLYGKNEQLLAIYMASYARHCIENKEDMTTFSATKAAVISMMTVYKKGIKIKKSKEMEKLILLEKENKLDDYLKENFGV